MLIHKVCKSSRIWSLAPAVHLKTTTKLLIFAAKSNKAYKNKHKDTNEKLGESLNRTKKMNYHRWDISQTRLT